VGKPALFRQFRAIFRQKNHISILGRLAPDLGKSVVIALKNGMNICVYAACERVKIGQMFRQRNRWLRELAI
jgi:hypothetical protein